MPSKEQTPAVKEQSSFAICRAEPEKLRDIVSLNLHGKKLDQFDLQRIKVPGGETRHWTIPGADKDEAQEVLEGVILFFKETRSWWPEKQVTGKPPSCKSDDAIKGYGKRYDDEEPGWHECSGCPHAEFGSDPKAGRGQYCSQKTAIFLLMEQTFLPSLLMLPATSIAAVQKLLINQSTYGNLYNSFVVGFHLQPAKNDDGDPYNKVLPKKSRNLTEEEYKVVSKYTGDVIPTLKSVAVPEEEEK